MSGARQGWRPNRWRRRWQTRRGCRRWIGRSLKALEGPRAQPGGQHQTTPICTMPHPARRCRPCRCPRRARQKRVLTLRPRPLVALLMALFVVVAAVRLSITVPVPVAGIGTRGRRGWRSRWRRRRLGGGWRSCRRRRPLRGRCRRTSRARSFRRRGRAGRTRRALRRGRAWARAGSGGRRSRGRRCDGRRDKLESEGCRRWHRRSRWRAARRGRRRDWWRVDRPECDGDEQPDDDADERLGLGRHHQRVQDTLTDSIRDSYPLVPRSNVGGAGGGLSDFF